jgi:hypothetical protein
MVTAIGACGGADESGLFVGGDDGGAGSGDSAQPVDGSHGDGSRSDTGGGDDVGGDVTGSACTSAGGQCVPEVPNGWTFVGFDANGRPQCPSNMSNSTDVVADPTGGAATCNCSCDVATDPSCTADNIGDMYDTNNTCSQNGGQFAGNGGACFNVNNVIQLAPYHNLTPPGATGGSCKAVTNNSVPPSSETQGRICGGPLFGNGGCGAGQVCAPAVAPLRACVTMQGDQACVGPYTEKHSVGTSISDTRDCTACSCSHPTADCVNGQLTFYTQLNCAGQSITLPVDGVCHPNGGGNASYYSHQYSATMQNPSCAKPPPTTPTGSLSLIGEETVCCTP